MIEHTSTPESPWYEVDADLKRRARLNCIAHLLSLVPYEDVSHPRIELPPRQKDPGYRRPPEGRAQLDPDAVLIACVEPRSRGADLPRCGDRLRGGSWEACQSSSSSVS